MVLDHDNTMFTFIIISIIIIIIICMVLSLLSILYASIYCQHVGIHVSTLLAVLGIYLCSEGCRYGFCKRPVNIIHSLPLLCSEDIDGVLVSILRSAVPIVVTIQSRCLGSLRGASVFDTGISLLRSVYNAHVSTVWIIV